LPCIFLFLAISAVLVRAVAIDQHLSADGVLYFASILDGESFARVDSGRRFAESLIQWPLVLAVVTGVTHVPLLSKVFGFGIYLLYVMSFGLCLWAVRRESPTALALPLLSMATVSLPSVYILAGEHQVMVLLASPILLLVLRREAPTWADGICLWVALLAFTRTYPTAIVSAFVVTLVLVVRMISDRGGRRELVIRGGALVLLIAAGFLGMRAILNPRDLVNRDLFGEVLFIALHPGILFPAAAAVFLLLSLLTERVRWWGPSAVASAVCLALYARFAFSSGHALTAHQSFAARTLTVTVLPLLLLLTALVHRRRSQLVGPRRAVLAAIVLMVTQANLLHSGHWARYRDEMLRLLRNERGYVRIEESRIFRHPSRWGWTSPSLSVVWSFPVVRAIVENAEGEAWEPFDPRKTLILKRYVRYDPVFAHIDPAVVN
jgi:hypothetical protein